MLIFIILLKYINAEQSRVIMIQPNLESYPINLFGSNLLLSNTSYSYNNESYPANCPELSIKPTKFIQMTSQVSFSEHFCPVYDWAPLYQPVHFYLSTQALDLIIYDQNSSIEIIGLIIHNELTIIDETIYCYSMFPYANNQKLAVDCTLKQTTEKVLVIFQLEYDSQLIIQNFTYEQMIYYQYDNGSYDNYINSCAYRITQIFEIITGNELESKIIQYCPEDQLNVLEKKAKTTDFYIIYEYTNSTPTNYTLYAYQGTSLNVTMEFAQLRIIQIYVNQLLDRYNKDTWTLLFLFANQLGIYKCQFTMKAKEPNFVCIYTVLEMFEPEAITTIQNSNQNLILLTWTDAVIYVVYLQPSIQKNDYLGLIFKDIFEEGFYVIDATLTAQYLAVIMSNNTKISQKVRRTMCAKFLERDNNNRTNLLKIFEIDYLSSLAYYTNYIPENAMFLNSLNYAEYGDYFIYFQTKQKEQNISLLQLFGKQLIVSFDALNWNTNCTQNLQAIVAIIEMVGSTIYYEQHTLKQQLIICLQNHSDPSPRLVANQIELIINENFNGLAKCPAANDTLLFFDITNSIDLLNGIMGPLLNFDYVPNPLYNQYFPYYLNYFYKINMDQEELSKLISKIYWSYTYDLFEKFDVFGSVEIIMSLKSRTNEIYHTNCKIASTQNDALSNVNRVHLSLQYCQPSFLMKFDQLETVDYLRQIGIFLVAIQYENALIQICTELEKNCAPVTLIETPNFNIVQVYVQQGPILGTFHYFIITILGSTSNQQILFFQFKVNEDIPLKLQTITAIPYNELFVNGSNKTFHSFKYAYINQICLMILWNEGFFTIMTQAPISDYQRPILSNYSNQVYQLDLRECMTMKDKDVYGFELTDFAQYKFNQKSLTFWCSNRKKSYIYQYQINSIYQLSYWRELPLYGHILSSQAQVFTSGLSFYVPVASINDVTIKYLVYNLQDFSLRMLLSSFTVPVGFQKKHVQTTPVVNLYDLPFVFDSVSFCLVLSEDAFFLFYLNQQAKFVFNLEKQFYDKWLEDLYMMVSQDGLTQVALFRNYTIVYDFYSTYINVNGSANTILLNSSTTKDYGNYYQYLLLINQSTFDGPVLNYNIEKQQSQATVIPSPYLQLNKYLGSFVDTINEYGLIAQLISLDNPIYLSLFDVNNTIVENPLEYQQLVLALTENYLLFYQKQSTKSNNAFQNCDHISMEQGTQNCTIRLLHKEAIQTQFNDNQLFCKAQLNQINSLIILCQTTQPQNKAITAQQLTQFNFTYNSTTNQVKVTQQFQQNPLYCYCYFYDMQPFFYGGTVYQVVRHTYILKENTFFGVYQLGFNDSKPYFNNMLIVPKKGVKPFNHSSDFTIIIQGHTLYIILLQFDYGIIQQINLLIWEPTNTTVMRPNKLKTIPFDLYYSQFDYVTAINQTLPGDTQPILVGNYNYAFEILASLSHGNFTINYIFDQYLLCESNFLEKPQFYSNNSQIQMLVTLCLTKALDYTSIEEEVTYIFGEPNTNIIYISYFIRKDETSVANEITLTNRRNRKNGTIHSRISYPVYIMESNLATQQSLHFLKIQVYIAYNYKGIVQPHLLLTNSTYFLIDYVMYTQQGYVIVYPASMKNDKGSQINLKITAYNQYSSNYQDYILTWAIEKPFHNLIWFYSIIVIFGIIVIGMLIYVCCEKFNSNRSKDPEIEEFFRQTLDKQGIELTTKDKQQSINVLNDAIRDIFINTNRNSHFPHD